jgi:hypothetical protein
MQVPTSVVWFFEHLENCQFWFSEKGSKSKSCWFWLFQKPFEDGCQRAGESLVMGQISPQH